MDGYSTAFPHSVAAVRSACPLANDLEGVFSAIHWALGLRVSNRRAKMEFHCLPGIAHRLRCVHSLAVRGRSERWNVRNARREEGTEGLICREIRGIMGRAVISSCNCCRVEPCMLPTTAFSLSLPLRYGHELRILRGARHVYRNERVRSPRRIVSTAMEREGRPARGEEGARGKNTIAAAAAGERFGVGGIIAHHHHHHRRRRRRSCRERSRLLLRARTEGKEAGEGVSQSVSQSSLLRWFNAS